ncbi:amino acid deaminase [Mycolicibacterium sp. P1-18]|uniref:alanine racemase n=1 Tax=Mycolicibacterium sp. P1-18 TaxID=2024615 RepID=UPI0011F0F521|nr:alanine racemase [Mycolicibacterium sp. P1-18]KAA0097517.1 amino acid deaminase [Mycolicibacterium sp. P1-18]
MPTTVDETALAALSAEPLDWRYKGLPSRWWGQTPAQVRAAGVDPFADGAVGPLCVLRESALANNLSAMADWCRDRGVELAPHGKTHMAPQLLARQFDAGATAVTLATISQVRTFRAFGVDRVVLANELVDDAGLRWLAGELDADPNFHLMCWVDSVRGVAAMSATLADAGARRPVDVCVEVGMSGGRTGCRGEDEVDAVARAAAESRQLRLVGVAGYEAATGHDVTPEAKELVRTYLRELRSAVGRLAPLFEGDEIVVSAGGSTYFDVVADELTGWTGVGPVRTVLRSGCYLTHDDGLYGRTSPLADVLRPALTVWAQVTSRPEPDLALVTMGRRDVSFDQDLPVPGSLSDGAVTKLNDQHAYLRVGRADRDRVEVGTWLEFGISHPCTVFDKWQLIPVLDDSGRVVDLVRTFF